MIPYFAIPHVSTALFLSIGLTAAILLLFGYAKGRFLGLHGTRLVIDAVQTLAIGAVTAAASYGIVRAVETSHLS